MFTFPQNSYVEIITPVAMVLAGETFGNVNNALIKVTHVVLIPSSM
jgi:hypothetical protein